MKPTSATPNPHDVEKTKKVMTKSPFAAEEIDRALFSFPSAQEHPATKRLPAATASQTASSSPHTQQREHYTSAMEIGFSNPRISIYSPMAASVLEYLDQTTPRFCKSEMGAKLLDKAIKEQFPEIWDTIFTKATTEPKWIELDRKRRKTKLQK